MINLKRDHKPKKIVFSPIVIVCLVFMTMCSSHCFAEDVTLSLSSSQGARNHTVSLTLSLSYPDEALASGFNLDIYFNPDVFKNITDVTPTATAGPVLIAAGKEMSTSHSL